MLRPLALVFALCTLMSACSTDEPSAPPTVTDETLAFLDANILAKASVKVHSITSATFEAAIDNNHEDVQIQQLCAQSKGYQSNIWEGLNDCSWAVEKQHIQEHAKFVEREGAQLKLKKEQGVLVLEHQLDDSTSKVYYQFSEYLPASKYYLVEILSDDKCVDSKLIDQNSEAEYLLNGKVVLSQSQHYFLAYSSHPNQKQDCSNKLAYYEWTAEGLNKKWELPFKNRQIQSLKLVGEATVYTQIQHMHKNNSEVEYLKIEL